MATDGHRSETGGSGRDSDGRFAAGNKIARLAGGAPPRPSRPHWTGRHGTGSGTSAPSSTTGRRSDLRGTTNARSTPLRNPGR